MATCHTLLMRKSYPINTDGNSSGVAVVERSEPPGSQLAAGGFVARTSRLDPSHLPYASIVERP